MYFTNQELGAVKECDLIAKGVVNGEQRGWASQRRDLVAFSLLTLIGLTLLRRRRRS
jgi:hypothetical protein